MTVTFGASPLQWVGVARETTYGTPVAAPTDWIPSNTPVWTPKPVIFVDDNLRGTMAPQAQQVQGLRSDTVTFKTFLYIDSTYFLLRSALGLPDVVTGTGAPYTHKTSVQSGNNGQPAGTTVFYYDAQGKSWQMPGAQIDSIKITGAIGALVTVDVTYMGLPAIPIAPPTNTPSLQQPDPSWNTTITVASTSMLNKSSFEWDISRGAYVVEAINGTQTPPAIGTGACIITGSIDAIYQGSTDTDLVNLLTNVQPAMTIVIAPVGDAVHTITFQTTVVAYDAIAISDGGGKYMQIKSTVKALTNATDVAGGGGLSNMLVSCVNTASAAI
jgi:hypothetical protein